MRQHSDTLGAQLLQPQLGDGSDIFYLSVLSMANRGAQPARGGVPVLFPQFANLGSGRKHGFARNVQWGALSDRHYQLSISPNEYDNWPHAAQLELSWEITSNTLQMCFTVRNTGSGAFEWSGGLHPYWLIPDLLQCRLTGFPSAIEWNDQAYEQLFDTNAELVLHCGSYALELKTTGFTQWMVWNPGREGSNNLADMPPQDWKRFVCVEPVCASRPVTLQPDETFAGTLTVRRVMLQPPQ
jgi:glucose-6-phosphate 1-epimerase